MFGSCRLEWLGQRAIRTSHDDGRSRAQIPRPYGEPVLSAATGGHLKESGSTTRRLLGRRELTNLGSAGKIDSTGFFRLAILVGWVVWVRFLRTQQRACVSQMCFCWSPCRGFVPCPVRAGMKLW